MKIAELKDPALFQDLVRKLMLAEHGSAYQVVDDSGGDGGLDGFLRTRGELHALYCPEKPDRARYTAKIRSDLEKARRLRDEHGYPIRIFVFITPHALREPWQRELRDAAQAAGFEDGVNLSGEFFEALLARYRELQDDFPALSYPRVAVAVQELRDGLLGEGGILDRIGTKPQGAPSNPPVRPGSRRADAAALAKVLARPDGAPLLLLVGSPGAIATTTPVAFASLGAGTAVVEADLDGIAPAPELAGMHAWVVSLIRRIAASAPESDAFSAAWTRFQKAFDSACRIKSLQRYAGYNDPFRSLLSLGRNRAGRGRSRGALVDALLDSSEDYQLLLRPHEFLVSALQHELVRLGPRVIVHMSGTSAVPDLALAWLARDLSSGEGQAGKIRLLVSLSEGAAESRSGFLRRCDTFQLTAFKERPLRDDVRAALRQPAEPATSVSLDILDQLCAYGSIQVVEFLHRRPSLLRLVLASADAGRMELRLACLATAYDVTPALLAEVTGGTPLAAQAACAELLEAPNGARMLPTGVAHAILSATCFPIRAQAVETIGRHLAAQVSDQGDETSSESRRRLASAYHQVVQHEDFGSLDRWLVRHFRHAFTSAMDLHSAMVRLGDVHLLSRDCREALEVRLRVTELIEAGFSADPEVARYFERVATAWAKVDPRHSCIAYYQLGQLALSRGEWSAAADAARLAIGQDAESHAAYSLWGLASLHDGQKEWAKECFMEALHFSPDYDFAYFNLGYLAEDQARYAEAVEHYSKAIQLDPSFWEAIYNLCNVMLEVQHFGDAARLAEYAARIAPEFTVKLRVTLGTALMGAGHLALAKQILKDSYALRRDGPIAHNIALTCMLGSEWRPAADWAQTAVNLYSAAGDQKGVEKARELLGYARRRVRVVLPEAPAAVSNVSSLDALIAFLQSRGYVEKHSGLVRSVLRLERAPDAVSPAHTASAPQRRRKKGRSGFTWRAVRYPSYGGG